MSTFYKFQCNFCPISKDVYHGSTKSLFSFILIWNITATTANKQKTPIIILSSCYNYRCNIIKVPVGTNTPPQVSAKKSTINIWQHDLSIQYNNTSLELAQLNFWNFYYNYKLHHLMPVYLYTPLPHLIISYPLLFLREIT